MISKKVNQAAGNVERENPRSHSTKVKQQIGVMNIESPSYVSGFRPSRVTTVICLLPSYPRRRLKRRPEFRAGRHR